MKTKSARWLLLLCCFLTLAASAAIARDRSYEPRKGSAERRAIIEATRAAYYRRFKKKATFEVWDMRAQDGYAAIYTKAELPGGKHGGNFSAILRGNKTNWKVLGAFYNQENISGVAKLKRRYPRIPLAVTRILDTP